MKCECPCDDNGEGNNEHKAYKCETKTKVQMYKRDGKIIMLCLDCVLPGDENIENN